MNASEIYNMVEIGLWTVFGLGFLVHAALPGTEHRLRSVVVAIAFVLFALSDYIELQTGSWWRPIWLMVLKVGCVAVFILALRHHLLVNKKAD